jgi:ABC-2 type transport system permease protein
MSLIRIAFLIRKEFTQIRRDPIYLTMILVLPAFVLILYGYALNFDVKHLALAVLDEDKSSYSRELIQKITSGEYFDLKYYLNNRTEIDRLLDREDIKLAVVIPKGFARSLDRGESASIQVIADGANSSSASTGLGYLTAIFQQYSLKINLKFLNKAGLRSLSFPLEARIRIWYNPELKSSRFLVPGLMAFILMIITVLATSLSIVREKEKGTIEQLLLSPLSPEEMIIGKVIPYLLLSIIGAHLVLLVGKVLFGIDIIGNYFLLLFVLIIFLFCGLSQGLLISAIANSQQIAFVMAGLSTLLPAFVLSGFVFPIRNMPLLIQGVTYIIPARYFLVCLRSIILKGVGLSAFYKDVIFLFIYAVVITFISSRKLKKSLDR